MKEKARLVKESLISNDDTVNFILIPDDYHGAPVVELGETAPYSREEIGNISTGTSYGIENAEFDDDFLQQFSPNPELHPGDKEDYDREDEYWDKWEIWWGGLKWDEIYLQVNYIPIFKYAYSIKFLDGKIPSNIEEILNNYGDSVLYEMFFEEFTFDASEKPESDVQTYIDSLAKSLGNVIITAKGPQTFISS